MCIIFSAFIFDNLAAFFVTLNTLFFFCFFLYVFFVVLAIILVQAPPTRKIGSIADYDPLNDNYGSLGSSYRSAGHQDVSNMYRGRFCVKTDFECH